MPSEDARDGEKVAEMEKICHQKPHYKMTICLEFPIDLNGQVLYRFLNPDYLHNWTRFLLFLQNFKRLLPAQTETFEVRPL